MPDISKCDNKSCPSKDSCYRFTSMDSPFWQSYGGFQYDEETGKCDHYWNNKKYKKEKEHGKDN